MIHIGFECNNFELSAKKNLPPDLADVHDEIEVLEQRRDDLLRNGDINQAAEVDAALHYYWHQYAELQTMDSDELTSRNQLQTG